jgi:hypothetical protein
MKASDVPEAFRLQQNLKHVEEFMSALPGETIHIQVGSNQIHIGPDDPQRPLLNQAVSDMATYIRNEAETKLRQFDLEPDLKPSEISGFPEDDIPPPVDPV